MEEIESLRREIEVRLWRETIYRAVNAFKPNSLDKAIEENDKVIKKIGKFLEEKGSEWEKQYAKP